MDVSKIGVILECQVEMIRGCLVCNFENQPTKRPFANDNPNYPQKVSDQPETNFALLNYNTSGRVSDVWRVIQLNGNAEYEILDGLKAKAMLGYYFGLQEFDNQEYKFNLYAYDEKQGSTM